MTTIIIDVLKHSFRFYLHLVASSFILPPCERICSCGYGLDSVLFSVSVLLLRGLPNGLIGELTF